MVLAIVQPLGARSYPHSPLRPAGLDHNQAHPGHWHLGCHPLNPVYVCNSVLRFQFVRDTGKPTTVTDTFTLTDPVGEFILVVQNGDPGSGEQRVTSGQIDLNGVRVVAPGDFR